MRGWLRRLAHQSEILLKRILLLRLVLPCCYLSLSPMWVELALARISVDLWRLRLLSELTFSALSRPSTMLLVHASCYSDTSADLNNALLSKRFVFSGATGCDRAIDCGSSSQVLCVIIWRCYTID